MFDDLLKLTTEASVDEFIVGVMNSKSLAKKINKFFDKMSLPTPDEKELINNIENLTDNARSALSDAVKEQDTNKLINILGLKDIIKIRR